MKTLRAIALSLTVCALPAAHLIAQDAPPAPAAMQAGSPVPERSPGGRGPGGGPPRGPSSPLETEMKNLNRNLRTLGRQLGDASKKDDSLKLIAEVEKNVVGTHTLSPSNVDEVPEAERAEYIARFHKRMEELHAEIGKLKEAVTADKADEAKAILSNLNQLKRKGHEEFNVDDDGPGKGGPGGGPGGPDGQRGPRRP